MRGGRRVRDSAANPSPRFRRKPLRLAHGKAALEEQLVRKRGQNGTRDHSQRSAPSNSLLSSMPSGTACRFDPGAGAGDSPFLCLCRYTTKTPGTLFHVAGRYVDNEDEFVFSSTKSYGSNRGVWWEEIRDMKAGELRPARIVSVCSSEIRQWARARSWCVVKPWQRLHRRNRKRPRLTRHPLRKQAYSRPCGVQRLLRRGGDWPSSSPPISRRVRTKYGPVSPTKVFPTEGMQWTKATVSSPEMGKDAFVYDSSNEYYGDSGTWTEAITMHSGGTLPPGDYRVEFSLLQHGYFWPVRWAFTVTAREGRCPNGRDTGTTDRGTTPSFGPIAFCDDVAEDGTPINPAESLSGGHHVRHGSVHLPEHGRRYVVGRSVGT